MARVTDNPVWNLAWLFQLFTLLQKPREILRKSGNAAYQLIMNFRIYELSAVNLKRKVKDTRIIVPLKHPPMNTLPPPPCIPRYISWHCPGNTGRVTAHGGGLGVGGGGGCGVAVISGTNTKMCQLQLYYKEIRPPLGLLHSLSRAKTLWSQQGPGIMQHHTVLPNALFCKHLSTLLVGLCCETVTYRPLSSLLYATPVDSVHNK